MTGDIDYTGTKSFDWNAYVQDICPADGVGVSMHFEIDIADSLSFLTGTKVKDTDGCGNGWDFDYGNVTRIQKIVRSRAWMCWTNDGNDCWAQNPDAHSTWKDNPYT